MFWVWGADGGRVWVGFGRLDHFASKSCSIRMRFGTVLLIKKNFFYEKKKINEIEEFQGDDLVLFWYYTRSLFAYLPIHLA